MIGSRPKRGISLAEVMVSAFVFSLLMTVVFQVFVPAMRAWSDGQRRSEASQGLLVTTNWIGDDIVRSSPDSLTVNEQGLFYMTCTLGAQEDYTADFNELVVYWVKDKVLYRAHRSMGEGSSAPLDLTMDEVTGFNSVRRMATGVELFEVKLEVPWRADIHMKVKKDGRESELRTAFSSIFAPFDPNVAERTEEINEESAP